MIENSLNDLITSKQFYEAVEAVNKIDIIDQETDCISNKKILCKNFLYNILYTKKQELVSGNSKVKLKKLLTSQMYTGNKLIDLLEKFPGTNRNVGKIPKDFFKKVPFKRHKECAIKLYEILAKYSLILNYDYSCDIDDDDYITCRDKELGKELTKLLKQKVNVLYVNHGCNGNGFKLTVNNKNYFYKVFYPHNKPDKISIETHGSDAEIPFALFANKYGRYGQFVKFYFGRVASKYEKDCFMITEFLEKKEVQNNTEKLHVDYITINNDELRRSDNTINGKIVDFGGLVESCNPDLKNPKMRRLIRVICKHINYKFNYDIFAAKWEINQQNFDSLKKYVMNNYDEEYYLKAVNIIKENIKNIPPLLIKTLVELNHPVKIEEKLSKDDIITTSLERLLTGIEHYNIQIKTSQKPSAAAMGYMIIGLNNKKHGVFRFDINNKIQEIRFEKLADGKIELILKLSSSEIENCNIPDLSNILG